MKGSGGDYVGGGGVGPVSPVTEAAVDAAERAKPQISR